MLRLTINITGARARERGDEMDMDQIRGACVLFHPEEREDHEKKYLGE